MADNSEGVEEAAEVLQAVMAEVGDRPCPVEAGDAEAWLEAAAAVVDDVPQLDISQWLCVVAALTIWGPRTEADKDALASIVAETEGGDPAELATVFATVESRWQALGALDEHQRLSALGWWGLPEALLRAWSLRR